MSFRCCSIRETAYLLRLPHWHGPPVGPEDFYETTARQETARSSQSESRIAKPHSAVPKSFSSARTWMIPTAAVMPRGTMPKHTSSPAARLRCVHSMNFSYPSTAGSSHYCLTYFVTPRRFASAV